MDAQRVPPSLDELLARLDRLSRAVHLGEPLDVPPAPHVPPLARPAGFTETTRTDPVISDLVARVTALSREVGILQDEVERLRARNADLETLPLVQPTASPARARFTLILSVPRVASVANPAATTTPITSRPAPVTRATASPWLWWRRHRRAAVLAGLLSAGLAVTIAAAASSSSTPLVMASATTTRTTFAMVKPSPTATRALPTPTASPTLGATELATTPSAPLAAARDAIGGIIGESRQRVDRVLGAARLRDGARIYRDGAIRVTFVGGVAVAVEIDTEALANVDPVDWLAAQRPDDARLIATHWSFDGSLTRVWQIPARRKSTGVDRLAGARWQESLAWDARTGRPTRVSITLTIPQD